MSKQKFLGLVKFSGTYEAYQGQKALGKLIFAEVNEGENIGKYIYANGLEYKVADSTNLDKLAERVADVSQDVIDISTRLSNVGITAAVNKLSVNGKDVALSGSDYVTVTAANNSVNVSLNAEKIQDGGSAVGHEKLATKGYVDEQISVLEQALVFKGEINATNAEAQLTTAAVQAGYTYVATGTGEYNSQKFEAGDLIIVKVDAEAGTTAEIIVVERNLDGAVTTGGALDSSKLVVGTGDQGVKTIDVTAENLATAIANANSAIQGVKAAGTQNEYVKISVENSGDVSTKDVSATLTVVNTSVDLAAVAATGKLVDAKAVKDLVSDVKVQATLNSSTPDYVVATASVDETGRIISSSVGVKVATLLDASNGGADYKALADARNVYEELTAVEEVMATANSEMVLSIGLNSDYSVTWSTASGISTDASIVKAIEEVAQKAEQALQSSVKSIEGETGISERANDEYIAVSASKDAEGKVTLDSSVQLATAINLNGITGATAATATGLATDATVKDYVAYALAWDVIGG